MTAPQPQGAEPSAVVSSRPSRRPWQSPPPLRGVRAAFAFLSRIPVGGFPYRDEDWRWAPAHFPLVGVLVGATAAACYWVARPLGANVAASLAVLVMVVLSGALHEDGLADSADALGGNHGCRRMVEILKDSRVGTYGAVAVCGSLVLRVACVAELDSPWPLVLVAGTARIGPAWLIACLPHIDPRRAKSLALLSAGPVQAVAASLWGMLLATGLVASGTLSTLSSAGALVSVATVALALGVWFRARAGGITGDFLGATEQVGEIVVLLAVLAEERLGG